MTAQPDTTFPELDDPEFIMRFDAAVAVEQAAFDAWLAEDRFDELIATAKAEAQAAHAAAASLPDFDDDKSTWASVDLGHRRARHLVQALSDAGLGHVEVGSWAWVFSVVDVLGKRRRGQWGTARQCHAAVEVFALAVSRPGFELRIARE